MAIGTYRPERHATTPTPGTDGFDAFGKPVSTARQAEAVEVAIGFGVGPFLADGAIQEAAMYVERDDIEAALKTLYSICDLTGAYLLLAVMCTACTAEQG